MLSEEKSNSERNGERGVRWGYQISRHTGADEYIAYACPYISSRTQKGNSVTLRRMRNTSVGTCPIYPWATFLPHRETRMLINDTPLTVIIPLLHHITYITGSPMNLSCVPSPVVTASLVNHNVSPHTTSAPTNSVRGTVQRQRPCRTLRVLFLLRP